MIRIISFREAAARAVITHRSMTGGIRILQHNLPKMNSF